MKGLSGLERWLVGVAAALFVMVATLAALHLHPDSSVAGVFKDPLKPDATALDQTGETAGNRFRTIDLQRAEAHAVEKFGPLPAATSADELALAAEANGGSRALEDLQRLRDIQKTKGSEAAAAAFKSLKLQAAR